MRRSARSWGRCCTPRQRCSWVGRYCWFAHKTGRPGTSTGSTLGQRRRVRWSRTGCLRKRRRARTRRRDRRASRVAAARHSAAAACRCHPAERPCTHCPRRTAACYCSAGPTRKPARTAHRGTGHSGTPGHKRRPRQLQSEPSRPRLRLAEAHTRARSRRQLPRTPRPPAPARHTGHGSTASWCHSAPRRHTALPVRGTPCT